MPPYYVFRLTWVNYFSLIGCQYIIYPFCPEGEMCLEEGLKKSNDIGVKLRKETPISASLLLVDALLAISGPHPGFLEQQH